MKFGGLIATAVAAALPLLASGYEVACLYPPNMPDPFQARYLLHEFSGSYFMKHRVETPVVIHVAAMSSICQANCLAYHDDKVLNALTYERPIVTIPSEYHNAWSRMLCIAQCFHILSDEAERPDFYKPFFDKWGLEGIENRRGDVGIAFVAARDSGDASVLQSLLQDDDYHPFTVGQIIATELLLYVIDDGWNALGDYTYDAETGQPVKCTANCERYKDTTGYFPKSSPNGSVRNGTDKYLVEGDDMRWQPLLENDGNGFFSAQQFITPHIGFMAKPKLYESVEDFPSCPAPNYDYHNESLVLIERLKETVSDSIKKQKIAFYDGKLLVINLVETFVKNTFKDRYSFEDELLYIEGMSAGEYEATLMAWRAKVVHDLARPTTVIRRWGSDVLTTFTGNKTVNEPGKIAARDFQAFQRIMPHAEYPSGSSCICTAYGEMTDEFTKFYFNDTLKNVVFGAAGTGTGFGCNPEQDPPLFHSAGCEDDFTIVDMPTLIHECSQSRLWGGIHYTAAITEGEKMCVGIGVKAAEHERKLRNGSTLGQRYFIGDPRPVCSNPAIAVEKNGQALTESAANTWSTLTAAIVAPLLAASATITMAM